MMVNSYAFERALYGGVDPNSDFSLRCESGREYVDRISRGDSFDDTDSKIIGHYEFQTDWIKWTEFKQNFLDENEISFYMANKNNILNIHFTKNEGYSKEVLVRHS